MLGKTTALEKTDYGTPAVGFVILLFLLYACFLFGLPAYKFHYVGGLTDINHFSEAFATAARGELFHNHSHYWDQMERAGLKPEPHETASLFGMHFRPFFFLLLPIYKLFPSVYTLFAIQALIVASALFPLFLLCRHHLDDSRHTLLAITVFVCYPLATAPATNFFPSYMAIPFLFWALLCIERNKMIWLCLNLLVILSIKEILAVPVFLCGIYCFLKRSKWLGCLICLFSIAYLFLCLRYIIPHFAASSQTSFLQYFGNQQGGGLLAILEGLAPRQLIAAFYRHEVWTYLANIFIPLLALPLFSWQAWLSAPVFLQNILAVNTDYTLYVTGHLTAPTLPFLYYGFILTITQLKRLFSSGTSKTILLITLVLSAIFSASILSSWTYRDDTLKAGAESIKPYVQPGDIIAFAGTPDLHVYFSDHYEIAMFLLYKKARWNIIRYDAAQCRNFQDPPSEEAYNRMDPLSRVSNDICTILQDSCHKIYFNKPHTRKNSHQPDQDMHLLIFENTCLDTDKGK